MLGNNHRLTALQAALGIAQLRRLDSVVAERSELPTDTTHPHRYPGIGLPPRPPGRRSAWHLYAIEIDPAGYGCDRDEVIDALRAEGIEATLHYPAVHLLALYRERGGVPGIAPRAERLSEQLITLPLYPAMTVTDQDDVVLALQRIHVWGNGRRGQVVTSAALLAADCGRGVGLGHPSGCSLSPRRCGRRSRRRCWSPRATRLCDGVSAIAVTPH